ncbi:MAG: alpha/beta hydrolase [Spirochaetaceae bacterium]|nr:alpha/beta hydrolase [Spirochaetaceae bacterium]
MKRFLALILAAGGTLALYAQLPAGAPVGAPAGAPAGMPPMGAGGPPAPVDTSFVKTKFLDLAYAPVSKTQTLDIYLPNSGKGPYPVIITVHGGAFAFGDNRGPELAVGLKGLERGYAVVGVNYRLSGEAIFPAAIEDVKAAIRFLRANAAKYGLDPGRFALWGSSAGGNLVSLAGTSGDVADFKNPKLGNEMVSDRVQAVVDWYGPIDFTAMDGQFKASGIAGQVHDSADSFESKYLGAQITTVPALVAKTNPATYIDAKDPPFFIQHGTADATIPTRQSRDFAARLAKIIGIDKVFFEAIEGAGHGGARFETPENLSKVLDFLDGRLK